MQFSWRQFRRTGRGTEESPGGPSTPQLIRENILAIPLPVGFGNVEYTLCYAIVDTAGDVHVIDPGDDAPGGRELFRKGLERIGKRPEDVASVTATHFHPDHIAMAEHIREVSGASLGFHTLDARELREHAEGSGPVPVDDQMERWGVPMDERGQFTSRKPPANLRRTDPDRTLSEGDDLGMAGITSTVLHTPGHTNGHICIVLPDESVIMTGDHVIPTITPGVGFPGPEYPNLLSTYLSELQRIAAWDTHEVLPGHGYTFEGLAVRANDIRRHHMARTADVEAVLTERPDSNTWEVATALRWSGGWKRLHPAFRFVALAQTAMHMDLSRHGLLMEPVRP